MKYHKCQREIIKIIEQVGKNYGFELDTRQLPFLSLEITQWINKHFGLEEDRDLRIVRATADRFTRMKKTQQ